MSHTAASLKKQTVADLRELAEELGLDTEELKRKQELIDAILESQVEEEDDIEEEDDLELDDDEEDDDLELDDEESDEEEDDDLELEEDEEDDEEEDLEEEAPAPKKATPKKKRPEPTGDTYTAKQVATRIGTDAKTLRKFFRSPASTIEAVGQGGRYEFDKADLPTIEKEFAEWSAQQKTRAPRKAAAKATKPAIEVDEVEEDEALEFDEGDFEPEEEEEDDLELDLDEDDEEED